MVGGGLCGWWRVGWFVEGCVVGRGLVVGPGLGGWWRAVGHSDSGYVYLW